MYSQRFKPLLLDFVIVAAIAAAVDAKRQCISAVGVLKCRHDPLKATNVDVIAYDRDGPSIFQLIDPDDMMGRTFSNDHGVFRVEGCGSDFDFLPGLYNMPDPYVTITHYCNKEEGETIELPEFYTFIPNTKDYGEIELDDPEATDNSNNDWIDLHAGGDSRHIPAAKLNNYRTASRSKEAELQAEVNRLIEMLHGSSSSSSKSFATTPHVGIDDDASPLEEADHQEGIESEAWPKISGDGKWKNRYTFEGVGGKKTADEITTVTLPDEIALSDARDVAQRAASTLN